MMEKYRKKPIVIEAEQWHKVTYDREAGHGYTPAHSPIYHLNVGFYRRPEPEYTGTVKCKHCGDILHNHGWIETLEGGHIVCPGDWIIKGVNGEYYPCKPDVFKKTYDACEGAKKKKL